MMIRHPKIQRTVLKDAVFEPLGLSVSEAADRLKMSRAALSRVLNGHAAISPELAIRLEAAGVSDAKFWLNMQTNFDLAKAKLQARPAIGTIQDREAA